MRLTPKLYEINTVVWLDELGRKHGRRFALADVPAEEWDRLKRLGFDYVWLMGVWERSRAGREFFRGSPEWPAMTALFDSFLPGWQDVDVVGSPYSIASYTPDPLVGEWGDIDAARRELHRRGMRLVLDFVPNHTAPDHSWIFAHPGYYFGVSQSEYERGPALFNRVLREGEVSYIARGKDPYFPAWPDTAQLNHFNPETRLALIEEMRSISRHCDGLRCDMAMLVLNDIFSRNWAWAGKGWFEMPVKEFWKEVRDNFPALILIAEAYWDTEQRLQGLGFDYVYDKKFYDCLRSSQPGDILHSLGRDISFQRRLVRFLENHDEARSSEVFAGGKLYVSATVIATVPGMKLYYHGQLEGKTKQAPLLFGRAAEEETNPAIAGMYEKIFRITSQKVFHSGAFRVGHVAGAWDNTSANLIAYTWKDEKRTKLVVVNLADSVSQGRIPLGDVVSRAGSYELHDEVNDTRYLRSGEEMSDPGLHVILEGFQTHIFDISPLKRG
jgi:hypothetical protein